MVGWDRLGGMAERRTLGELGFAPCKVLGCLLTAVGFLSPSLLI